MIVEQAVLAALGSAAGVAVAWLALPALVSRIPAEVPRVGQIALDWSVLASVLAASIGVAVAVALIPAAVTARPNVQSLLRQSRTTDTPARRRALGALVSVQIALAVVLGIGAMLMLRSLWNLQRVDPGFTPANVLTFRLQTTSKYRALTNGLPYLEQVRERVAAIPGVVDVGLAGHLPMSGYSWTMSARRSDRPLAPGTPAPQVGWRFVHGDYFKAMRIPLKWGRPFSATDATTSAQVAIVNETLARQYFDEPSAAVGRTLVVTSGRTGQDEPLKSLASPATSVTAVSISRLPGAVPAVHADVHVPDGDGGAHRRDHPNRSPRRCGRRRLRSIRLCRSRNCSRTPR